MDSREAAPVAGSRCSTIVTSLRAPPTSWGLPKSWASWGASPVRVLFPTIRMFSEGRDLLAASGVRRFERCTLRTWSKRNRAYAAPVATAAPTNSTRTMPAATRRRT